MSTTNPKIVVGFDGSKNAFGALHWAEHYAETTAGSLEIVTVWEWPVSYGYPAIPPGYSPETDAKQVAERAVAELSLPPDRISTTVVEGGVGPELVRRSANADLLVVGRHGYGPVESVLLGSVSRYCAHHSTVPVVFTSPE